jgi:hypothetical protein
MPWRNGVFHDYFTADERAAVQRLELPLYGYVSVRDFAGITLDGWYSLDELRAFVEGLEALRQAKTGGCACGDPACGPAATEDDA